MPRSAVWVTALLGLALASLYCLSARSNLTEGANDFVALYAGARLFHTAEQYDAARVREVELASAGMTGPAMRVIRPPFVGLLMAPLGRLPYRVAYPLWIVLNLGALAGFLALWTETDRLWALAAVCGSIPLASSFVNGQDVPFLLLWIALSLRLHRTGRPFAAGLVLSLCAAKFHLFTLLPFLLGGRYLWGAAAGGGMLVGLSFAAAGWGWPAAYWQALTAPEIHPQTGNMPSLHAMIAGFGGGSGTLIALSAVVLGISWQAVRRAGWPAALIGGILLSYHSYVADCALLIPALLMVANRATDWQKYVALALLSPAAWFALLQGGHIADVPRAAMLVWLVGATLPRLSSVCAAWTCNAPRCSS